MRTSDSISEIAKALNGFQAEIDNPPKTADNPFFKSKYTPLAELIKHCRPTLAKHGLAVFQSASGDGERIAVTTLLMHTSGEWIESCPLNLTPQKKDPQGMGGAITYGCRYSYSAALCVASEDDDDGNHASKPEAKEPTKQPTKQPTKPEVKPLATEKQLKKIYAMAKEAEISPEDMKEVIYACTEKNSSKELTPDDASSVIAYLETQKEAAAV